MAAKPYSTENLNALKIHKISQAKYDKLVNGEIAGEQVDPNAIYLTPAEDYATKDYVDNAIAEAELGGNGETVDLSYLVTKTDADNTYVNKNLFNISGKVTQTVGGIEKGKEYSGESIKTILENMLFHAALIFSRITTSESSGTYEYGTEVTISKVTPTFTPGSKPITSIKIGTESGGSDLFEGTTATSGTAIPLDESKWITFGGTTGGTIYCTLSDGETSKEEKASVSYAYYTYYAVTDSTDTPTSWTSVGSASVRDITIDANADQYIWIASTGDYANIYELNELSNSYGEDKLENASPTTKTTSQTLVNSQNYPCTKKYNFYRLTDARTGNGSSKFLLK